MKVFKIISEAPLIFFFLFLLALLYSLDVFTDYSTFEKMTYSQMEDEIIDIENLCSKSDCLESIKQKIDNSKGNENREEILKILKKTVLCVKHNKIEKINRSELKVANNLTLDNQRIKLGLCYAEKGIIKEAEKIFLASSQRKAKEYLAQLYAINGQKELAIQVYQKIINEMPTDQSKVLSGIYRNKIENIKSEVNLNVKEIRVFDKKHKPYYQ